MSQNYQTVTSASDTAAAAWAKYNSTIDALVTQHSGSSAPSTTHPYMLWLDTSGGSAALKIRNGGDSGWITLFDTISKTSGTTPTGAGLVSGTSAAFTTAAPTSAVAASSATDLVRKQEVDARKEIVAINLGDISATTVFYALCHSAAVTISRAAVVTAASLTSSATDHWEINVRNVTAANYLKAAAYDTDPAVDGDLTAAACNDVGLDQNLTLSADDLLRFEFNKNGSIGNLTSVTVFLEYTLAT